MVLRNKTKSKKSILILFAKTMFMALIINLIIIVGMAAAYHTYKYCTTSKYFSLSNVKITGNNSLSRSDVLGSCGKILGENIFRVDVKNIHKSIESHPMIKLVSVEKKYPDKIIVSIVERTPFIVLEHKQTEYLIDNEGVILFKGKVPTASFMRITGIPVKKNAVMGDKITGERFSKGVEILNALKKLNLKNIKKINLKDKKKSLLTDIRQNMKIIINNNMIESGISNFKAIYKTLKTNKRFVDRINLSFKDKAVVTWFERG